MSGKTLYHSIRWNVKFLTIRVSTDSMCMPHLLGRHWRAGLLSARCLIRAPAFFQIHPLILLNSRIT
jgi:hypothetical protein